MSIALIRERTSECSERGIFGLGRLLFWFATGRSSPPVGHYPVSALKFDHWNFPDLHSCRSKTSTRRPYAGSSGAVGEPPASGRIASSGRGGDDQPSFFRIPFNSSTAAADFMRAARSSSVRVISITSSMPEAPSFTGTPMKRSLMPYSPWR